MATCRSISMSAISKPGHQSTYGLYERLLWTKTFWQPLTRGQPRGALRL